MTDLSLSRAQRSRLMQIWRSAGWPCQDAVEIDLLAAGLIRQLPAADGAVRLVLTDSGIAGLALARQRTARSLTAHDRLALRFGDHLLRQGRVVWRELSLRAATFPEASAQHGPDRPADAPGLWAEDLPARPDPPAAVWRMARPDLYSVRNTSVAHYLQPLVHEIKASRADLLSDLRHAAKRESYQWLCEACYYVFPAGIATADEIPAPFGVWMFHGALDDPLARFELLRPARHVHCEPPFAVWMALAKATPLRPDEDAEPQARLGAPPFDVPPGLSP